MSYYEQLLKVKSWEDLKALGNLEYVLETLIQRERERIARRKEHERRVMIMNELLLRDLEEFVQFLSN